MGPKTHLASKAYMPSWAEEKGVCGLGLGRWGRQVTLRWKRKCLVSKCLLAHEYTMGHRVDSTLDPGEAPPSHLAQVLVDISGDCSVLGTSPSSKFF